MKLCRVTYDKKMVLRHLLELYQYDTSIYEEEDQQDVNEYGLYGYKYLDHYWTEEGRHPFFVIVSGKLAGFVLVSDITDEGDLLTQYSISEFFIMKMYQRRGIGKKAAFRVFDQFKGEWYVTWLKSNLPAERFWTRIIGEYTSGNYTTSTFAGKPANIFKS